jgi:hypothetical protein
MKAYYLDDGIVIRGNYQRHKFYPDSENAGFGYATISEDQFGKTLFFDENLANNLVVTEQEIHRYEVVLRADFSNQFSNFVMAVEAFSAKEALNIVADFLYADESDIIFDWCEVLSKVDMDSLAEYLKKWNIVACGSNDSYASVVEIVDLGALRAPDRLVISDKIYNPYSYLEGMTGKCFTTNCVRNESLMSDIMRLLKYENVIGIKHFRLGDVEQAMKCKKPIVLVDCSHYVADVLVEQHYWFQVNDAFLKHMED